MKSPDQKNYDSPARMPYEHLRCKLLLNGAMHEGELIDLSLRGALFAPDHEIEAYGSKACRLHIEGVEPAINGIVVEDGNLLSIKFLCVRRAEQRAIEALAASEVVASLPTLDRDMSDLTRRRANLIQSNHA